VAVEMRLFKWFFALIFCVVLFFSFFGKSQSPQKKFSLYRKQPVRFDKKIKVQSNVYIVRENIQAGESLYSLLKKQKISDKIINGIIDRLKHKLDLRKLREGTKCIFEFSRGDHRLLSFSILASKGEKLVVHLDQENIRLEEKSLRRTCSLVVR